MKPATRLFVAHLRARVVLPRGLQQATQLDGQLFQVSPSGPTSMRQQGDNDTPPLLAAWPATQAQHPRLHPCLRQRIRTLPEGHPCVVPLPC